MKTFAVILLVIASAALGCSRVYESSQETVEDFAQSADGRTSRGEMHEGPVIEMKNGRLTYNGHELLFGAPVHDWEDTIGAECRSDGPYAGTCTWDDLGIFVHEDFKSDNVKSLTIKMQDYGSGFGDFQPRLMFTGRLIIDGILLYTGMSVDDFNSHSEMARFRCMRGIRICELSYPERNRSDINANVGARKSAGPIRSISLSVNDAYE